MSWRHCSSAQSTRNNHSGVVNNTAVAKARRRVTVAALVSLLRLSYAGLGLLCHVQNIISKTTNFSGDVAYQLINTLALYLLIFLFDKATDRKSTRLNSSHVRIS